MESNDLNFQKIHFKTPDTVDRNWLDWFREEFARQFTKVDMTPAPDTPFALEGTSRVLPDLLVYRGMSSPARSRNLVERSTDDDPALIVPISGNMSMHFDSKEIALTPGTATLVRNDVRAIFDVRSKAQFISIRLRRSRIEPLVHGFSDLTGAAIQADSQAMRLLLGYVQVLEREDSISAPETRHLVTAQMHELAALVLGATRDATEAANGNGLRAARFAAIKTDIAENLVRLELSVSSVAARQGVTSRYVQMLFEAEGTTFSHYVVGQRLARAHRMLTDPQFAVQPIGSISFACGFGDLSYFNRTFRRRYGMTPTDARLNGRRGK